MHDRRELAEAACKREKNDGKREAEKAEMGGEAKTEEKKKVKCVNNRMDGTKSVSPLQETLLKSS